MLKMKIRLAQPEDSAALLEIYLPYVRSSTVTFEEHEISEREFASRITDTLKSKPWLVAIAAGQAVGYAYAGGFNPRAAYRWSVNTAVYVAQGHHRKGIATRLYLALLDCLKILNYQNVLGGITLPNEASVQLHEGLGFKRVALYEKIGFKLGKWHDVAWYQLRLQDQANPPEPIALPQALERISGRLLQAK
jgi:phosphinothricin acetyltransferase